MTESDYSVKVKSKTAQQQYYKQIYSKHSLPTYKKQWSNYIENKTQIY